MMKEIGSEFWSVPITEKENGLFSKELSWYASGRFALKAIIKDIKKHKSVKTVGMPSWCCESMILPFLEEGLQVKFYSVYAAEDGLQQEFSECFGADVLLVMDYFGFSRIKPFEFDGIVICDMTHSVFSATLPGADYYFGSLRKWAGFYTGGFAYKKGGKLEAPQVGDSEYSLLRREAMLAKKAYIEGKTDSKAFLDVFAKANSFLTGQITFGAAPEDIQKAKNFDIELIQSKRKENAQRLIDELGEISVFSVIKKDDCPLFVPIKVKQDDRDRLKSRLISEKIYCPVHWPESRHHSLTDKTRKLYQTELSLICDQRYSIDDIERMASLIKKEL